MNYIANIRATASVTANVAPDVQIKRAAESCTYSVREYRLYSWFLGKVKVAVMGDELCVFYPTGQSVSPSRGDGWATSLIERALELLDGSPYEIPLEAGLITHVRPGLTTYRAA
jgi:hypothetical protein